MKVKTVFQAIQYSPERVNKAYVRFSSLDNTFYFCETTEGTSLDIRQGIVESLPAAIEEKAKARAGVWPSYVEIDKQLLTKGKT